MRYVRMLGLCLTMVVAVGAMSSASALAGTFTPEYEKLFNECPTNITELSGCDYGEAGKESFFQAGKVTVHFVKPVILRTGFIEDELGNFHVYGARNGNTISREAEPGPSLTEGIDVEKLEEPEKKRYEEYLAAGKSTKTTETVELAQPATTIYLNEGNLLIEEGTTFGFPVMIHISNPFLGKTCYDGNTVEPINVEVTTGATNPPPPNTSIHGSKGHITSSGEGTILHIGVKGNLVKLVNNSFAAPGVQGCGIDGGADAALDAGIGLPSPAGNNTTELIGVLAQAGVEPVREELHF